MHLSICVFSLADRNADSSAGWGCQMQMHFPAPDDTVRSVHCEAEMNWAVPRPTAGSLWWCQAFVVTAPVNHDFCPDRLPRSS